MAYAHWLILFAFEPLSFAPLFTPMGRGHSQGCGLSRGTLRLERRLMGSHRFLNNPSYTFALLSDPGRTVHISPFRYEQCCPHAAYDEGSNVMSFRGSITRLQYLLFTLHECRYRHPCKTRFWPMASLCQEGVEPSGLQRKVSDITSFFFPLSQPLPVANAVDPTTPYM